MFDRVQSAALEFIVLAALFVAITILTKGIAGLKASKRQRNNWRVNLSYFAADLLLVMPLLVIVSKFVQALSSGVVALGLEDYWQTLPTALTLLIAVAVSDFVGYWRHRLMHCPVLWPVHAAHHSDEDLNWFSLVRFHPLNRLIAVVFDAAILAALDLPLWAMVVNNRIRHFYGYFVHSNISWGYGPLRYLIVSPFLHRWHHATDIEARDKNFATIFSFYDVLFGSFYCPKHAATDLGVVDRDYPRGFWGQVTYPYYTLRGWAKRIRVSQGASVRS